VIEPELGLLVRAGRVSIGGQIALSVSTDSLMPGFVNEKHEGPKEVYFTLLTNYAF
jgi:hypothetical protein